MADTSGYFAHTLTHQPPADWEPLDDHLNEVAKLAGEFASRFDAGPWARLAGQWHDLGKYADKFQAYLKETAALADDDPRRLALRGAVNHATAGALHAMRELKSVGRLQSQILAYCIAGHHAGLPNSTAADGEQTRSGLDHRLKKPPPEALDALTHATGSMLHWPAPSPPTLKPIPTTDDPRRVSFQLAFYIRMLFSCLVDADFLCTERFMAPDRTESRPVAAPPMAQFAARVDTYIEQKRADAGDTPVNQQRHQVLRACLDAATQAPGLFALTVPTGGGKTLSSLAFALHHAAQPTHPLDRVIVAIPFTSIIEQNAAVFRRALGDLDHHVLEHHSNLDSRGDDQQTRTSRLAAENWEAPIIVTTNVQLLESLFAARTSRCRKLHRIARSVIVLDEAQALPPNLLAPTLAALQELVTNYGCSVVLCTATQPALDRRDEFPIGLDKPYQIIPETKRNVVVPE